MKLKLLFSALVILASGLAFKNHRQDVTGPQLSADEEAAILASTLQIAMFEYAPEAGGTESGGRGLGTLVAYDDELLIVTHDHWTPLTENLHEVELRNVQGSLLLKLDAQAFRALIVYRDGGTMILQAPEALGGLVPTTLAAAGAGGNTVWFTRRATASANMTVEVVAATMTGVEDATDPAWMRLRTVDGSAVLPGDSGGGVWANGQLIGNVWAGGVRETRYFWGEWLGGDATESSDLVIAALQPLGGQSSSGAEVSFAIQSSSKATHLESKSDMVTKEEKLEATLLVE